MKLLLSLAALLMIGAGWLLFNHYRCVNMDCFIIVCYEDGCDTWGRDYRITNTPFRERL